MVTAISLGPRFRARRQRAASHISATESGPPETASTTAGTLFHGAKISRACAAEIGDVSSPGMCRHRMRSPSGSVTGCLAFNPLLLTVHGGLHTGGGARIFSRHLAEGGAGGFLFLQRGQRLAEAEQRVGRLA